MVSDDFIGNWQKIPMLTRRALDARFFANPAYPFIRANWRVSGPSSSPILKPARIHIVSSTKQRPKQRNLLVGRRSVVNVSVFLIHVVSLTQSRTRDRRCARYPGARLIVCAAAKVIRRDIFTHLLADIVYMCARQIIHSPIDASI